MSYWDPSITAFPLDELGAAGTSGTRQSNPFCVCAERILDASAYEKRGRKMDQSWDVILGCRTQTLLPSKGLNTNQCISCRGHYEHPHWIIM